MIRNVTSLQHPLVKYLVKLRHNADYRDEHQSVVIDGIKPIREIGQTTPIKTLITYNETFIPSDIQSNEIVLVTEEVMQKISGMQQPEGLIAEFLMPAWQSLEKKKYLLALDGVSDPGNLGATIRTALALRWEGVFILGDSCDPFNDKALRAARGATFRLPMRKGTWSELKKLVSDNHLVAYVADLEGKKVDEVESESGTLLVLGNEAHGPSMESKEICQRVTIPITGEMESLNVSVAGGILMYVLRQRDVR